MTTKKFLSAEEVVELYGVDEAVLRDLVKDGTLKALADRGTWKFRKDDIDGLVRAHLLHPSKELPVVGEEAAGDILSFMDEGTGSSAVDFIELDEDALADQPTMIKPGEVPGLIPGFGDAMADDDDSSSEVHVVLEPMDSDSSDSDIRLAPPSSKAGKVTGDTSDSDVKTLSGLSAPKSAFAGEDSDSDVKSLSEPNLPKANASALTDEASDSDVKTLSTFEMAAEDSGISLESPGGDGQTQEIELEEDDGISLPPRSNEKTMEMAATSESAFDISSDSALGIDGSSVKSGDSSMVIDDAGSSVLDEDDSGISLDTGDSGISLDTGDSGISLETGDSGISLSAGDSGITLAADSGISLTDEPKAAQKLDKTEAMFDVPDDDFELSQTAPAGSMSDDDLEATAAFKMDSDDSATMPTVLGTDDEEQAPKAKKRDALGFSGAIAAGATIENLEVVDELDDMVPDSDDVTAAVFDDEEAEVLEASDESFAAFDEAPADDEMLSEEFEAPVLAKKEPKERGWGGLATASVLTASLLLAVNAWILWEGISTMWTGAEASGPAAAIISSLAGLSPL